MGFIGEFLAEMFAELFVAVVWEAMPRWLRRAVLAALLACIAWGVWLALGF